MKSKITIDVDYDNQPVIKIEYVASDDVRDKLVFKYLNSYGLQTSWAKLDGMNHEIDWEIESDDLKANNTYKLRPIKNYELQNESRKMQQIIHRYGLEEPIKEYHEYDNDVK